MKGKLCEPKRTSCKKVKTPLNKQTKKPHTMWTLKGVGSKGKEVVVRGKRKAHGERRDTFCIKK